MTDFGSPVSVETPESGRSTAKRRKTSRTAVASAVVLGVFLGLSFYTFGYARGASYLSDDAAACANCHVMNEQYAGWMKGSHRAAAKCNDCHTPPGLASKYATKARNGFMHSLLFTTGWFPDEIQITSHGYQVTEHACMKCHAEVVDSIRAVRAGDDEVTCIQCHAGVGHE